MDLAVLPPWQYSLLVQITQSDVICVTKMWKFGELLFWKQDRLGPILQYHFQVLFGQQSLLMSVVAKLCVKYSESMINAHAIQAVVILLVLLKLWTSYMVVLFGINHPCFCIWIVGIKQWIPLSS